MKRGSYVCVAHNDAVQHAAPGKKNIRPPLSMPFKLGKPLKNNSCKSCLPSWNEYDSMTSHHLSSTSLTSESSSFKGKWAQPHGYRLHQASFATQSSQNVSANRGQCAAVELVHCKNRLVCGNFMWSAQPRQSATFTGSEMSWGFLTPAGFK